MTETPCTDYDSLLEEKTPDGITLRIEHIASQGPTTLRPLILQHGFASNGLLFNFPNHSMAKYLATRGFHCYIPDMRGSRHSSVPHQDWSLDELIEFDIPTILRTVQKHSGSNSVDWVGHSLGGILMMMYAIENTDVPVSNFVALASALDFRPEKQHNVYHHLLPFLSVAQAMPFRSIPFDMITRMSALGAGYGLHLLPEQMNFWHDNIHPNVLRGMLERGFEKAPISMLKSLVTLFSESGLRRRNGSIRYLERAQHFNLRTFLTSGSRDPQCPSTAVQATAGYLSSATQITVQHFGREHGQAEEYGHFDLVVGKNAPGEVWPMIADWLNSHI